jgi:predicted cupin superfamily sugar epimerase
VPAGWWQAARSEGAYSLVTCVVAPGFEFADFELLGERAELAAALGRALPEALPFV